MLTIERSTPQPIYEQVREALQSKIAGGWRKAGDQLPEERELARQLRVSRTTTRRAVAALARQGIVTRVRGRGTFVRNVPRSRVVKAVRQSSLAVVSLPGLTAPGQSLFYQRILNGLHTAAEPRQMAILIRQAKPPYHDLAARITEFESLCGVVVLGIVNQEILAALSSLPVPVVLVDSGPAPRVVCWDHVTGDSEEGAYQAVAHLVRLGHREIALLNYAPATPASTERRAGYERALAEAGLRAPAGGLLDVPLGVPAAYAATRDALARGVRFSALFGTSDELALGAMAALRDHGLTVPRDVSVVGFGDLGYMSVPPLSSVHIALEQMGMRAVEMLEQRIAQPSLPARELMLPVEFVPRGTCDIPPPLPGHLNLLNMKFGAVRNE